MGATTDKAVARKERAAKRAMVRVRDRRRFKSTPIATGDPGVTAAPEAVGTLFPSRVSDLTDEPILKDGASNSKIGGDVSVGWLRGARILTLTLEERATCPRSCQHWQSCYGNAMPHPKRWRHGPELMERLIRETSEACEKHEAVLVRLHILGDFWSKEYVRLWLVLLETHANLNVFGFTAHNPDTEIGREVARVRSLMGQRFSVRHSGYCGPWGSFTIDFPTEKKVLGDALVCPEQIEAIRDMDRPEAERKRRHCGSCGACWSSDRPIVFVEH